MLSKATYLFTILVENLLKHEKFSKYSFKQNILISQEARHWGCIGPWVENKCFRLGSKSNVTDGSK